MIGQQYLAPGRFVDSDCPEVIEFARTMSAGANGATDAMLRLYCAVRDAILYDPYVDWTDANVFRWHSYCELHLDGKWVKATPAFNASLCERLGLEPLAFDGRTDSLFQPFDTAGRKHMEYVVDRGTFADVPFEIILADFRANYAALSARDRLAGDFQSEAVAAGS